MLLLLALPSPIILLVWLLIGAIVLAAAYWIINNVIPEPMRRWAWAVVIVVAAIFLITYILLPLAGRGGSL